MKFYVTNYALTKGIQEVYAEEIGNNMIRTPGPYCQYFHTEGKDWHRTIKSAKSRAEEMRTKKLLSLSRSVQKLSKLKF